MTIEQKMQQLGEIQFFEILKEIDELSNAITPNCFAAEHIKTGAIVRGEYQINRMKAKHSAIERLYDRVLKSQKFNRMIKELRKEGNI